MDWLWVGLLALALLLFAGLALLGWLWWRRRRTAARTSGWDPEAEDGSVAEATGLSALVIGSRTLFAGNPRNQQRQQARERREAKSAERLREAIGLLDTGAGHRPPRPTRQYPTPYRAELFNLDVELEAWIDRERARAFLRAGGHAVPDFDHVRAVESLGPAGARTIVEALRGETTGEAAPLYARLQSLLRGRNWLQRRFGQRQRP